MPTGPAQLARLVRESARGRRHRKLESHLANCDGCREARDELTRLNQRLRSLPIAATAGFGALGMTSGFTGGIEARLVECWFSSAPVATSSLAAVTVLAPVPAAPLDAAELARTETPSATSAVVVQLPDHAGRGGAHTHEVPAERLRSDFAVITVGLPPEFVLLVDADGAMVERTGVGGRDQRAAMSPPLAARQQGPAVDETVEDPRPPAPSDRSPSSADLGEPTDPNPESEQSQGISGPSQRIAPKAAGSATVGLMYKSPSGRSASGTRAEDAGAGPESAGERPARPGQGNGGDAANDSAQTSTGAPVTRTDWDPDIQPTPPSPVPHSTPAPGRALVRQAPAHDVAPAPVEEAIPIEEQAGPTGSMARGPASSPTHVAGVEPVGDAGTAIESSMKRMMTFRVTAACRHTYLL